MTFEQLVAELGPWVVFGVKAFITVWLGAGLFWLVAVVGLGTAVFLTKK